jgi:hypothetical protein
MKTSAKITTVTFLAAMALGAAALTGGCTVTSTTSNDVDGGTSSSGGSSSGGSSSGSTGDGGGDASATCDTSSQTTKYPAACQTCTENKCCDKITACFGQTPPDGGVDCNGYAECVSTCEEGTDDTCIDNECKATAPQSVVTAFDILQNCQLTNCEAECFE